MSTEYISKLDRAVEKATDATLLSDNWQYILDVCDKVLEEPEEGSKQIVELISKRLALRDANVQLRTLSLLTSIAENCGSRVRQEIASRQFTGLLLNKIEEPTVHKEIKIKIVQVLTQLSKSFSNDPSLKPVQDAYKQISTNFSQYFPPDKPQKQNLGNDRLKEEEDLKAAIALSLAENNQAPIPTSVEIQQQQPQVQQQQLQQAVSQSQQTAPQAKAQPQNFSRVRALYDSFSTDPADLHFRKGDIITVLDRVYKDWGKGSLRGTIGLFPFNYVTPLYDPTAQELLEESEKEAKILLQSRKIEKMLTMLSSGNDDVITSSEFQHLYQEIVLVKPELGELIEKYRVRRDELLDLHAKLKDATVKYEELTDPLRKPQGGRYQQGYYQQPQPQPQPQTQPAPQAGYSNIPQGYNYPPQTSFPQSSSIPQSGVPQQQQRHPIIPQQSTGSIATMGSMGSIPGNIPGNIPPIPNTKPIRTSYDGRNGVHTIPQVPQQQQDQQGHGSLGPQHASGRPYPY